MYAPVLTGYRKPGGLDRGIGTRLANSVDTPALIILMDTEMEMTNSIPWYKEGYIWICAAVAFLGLGIIYQDIGARHAKRDMLAVKNEADQFYSRQQYDQAVIHYSAMLAKAEGRSDPELRAASDDARRQRDQAQERLRVCPIRGSGDVEGG